MLAPARRPLVMLVTDDDEQAAALARQLAAYAIDVRHSRTGEEALARVASQLPVDAMLIDADAPACGFRRFLVELRRAQENRPPVALLVAGDPPPAFVRLLSSVRMVLAHPISEALLVSSIRELLVVRRRAA